VLQAIDIVKHFGATKVLRRASLRLLPGEAHALLGENGSGKSTLAKILCGIHASDEGLVELDGRACRHGSPAAAAALGICMVFQELSLAPHLTVLNNLFLGSEIRRGGMWIDRSAELSTCEAALARVGLRVDPEQLVGTLNMAQSQLLEIAKALLRNPRVLILDEPTARLGESEIVGLFNVLSQLKSTGIAILYVTHHLREVLRICDRVSLIRDGQVVATEAVTASTDERQLVELLTGGRAHLHQRVRRRFDGASPLLEVDEIRATHGKPVSMTIRAGEIVGVYGVMGCGREALLRLVAGTMRTAGGRMRLDAAVYAPLSPRAALSRGVVYLCADRKDGGVFPNLSLRENYTICALPTWLRGCLVRPQAERMLAEVGFRRLKVHFSDMEQPITALSGGNQQKILFGRAAEARPRLFVLEDPTAGIDVGAKQDLYRTITEAASSGAGCLWASSDIVETLSLCDRVYAMHGGRIVAELVDPELHDEPVLMSHVLGMSKEAVHG
jgi:ribose transport system ATP-binding protein